MFWFWIIFNYFKVSCSHNSILTCHIAGLIFLPQCSTVKYPPKKGEWRTLKYKSKPDLFITSGDVVFQFHFPDPHQWKSLSLKHWPASHLDWRWRCLLSLPSRAAAIAASKPRVPTVAIHYCIPLAWPQVLSLMQLPSLSYGGGAASMWEQREWHCSAPQKEMNSSVSLLLWMSYHLSEKASFCLECLKAMSCSCGALV